MAESSQGVGGRRNAKVNVRTVPRRTCLLLSGRSCGILERVGLRGFLACEGSAMLLDYTRFPQVQKLYCAASCTSNALAGR